MSTETYDRGLSHGWDAANYAEAYGTTETPEAEAFRRAEGDADYAAGFLQGRERYDADQWQDGTPRDEDED